MVCYIGVGSNIGDRWAYINKAVEFLKNTPGIRLKKVSSVYETKPQGGPRGQGDYLNLVLMADCSLEPGRLLKVLQTIEKKVGRKPRKRRRAAREIDLDILFYGGERIEKKALKVPHPLIQDRFFVLKPLSDIAPSLKHSLSGRNVSAMLLSLRERGRWRKCHEEIIP
ncbi:MAG: 2-amino-4-hydroxy-6-hydroxymethyldihydropteridine diphosphokinase [Candidatus Omnitrophota bacterium]